MHLISEVFGQLNLLKDIQTKSGDGAYVVPYMEYIFLSLYTMLNTTLLITNH